MQYKYVMFIGMIASDSRPLDTKTKGESSAAVIAVCEAHTPLLIPTLMQRNLIDNHSHLQ